uniref:Uncharacterized protein n=1 Tax=Phlebotomus papatasi TaxID=29031 RepID=A0A1B0GNF7_PHLPP
ISSTKVHNAVKSEASNPSAEEKRGKTPSKNKTPEHSRSIVRSFIASIPSYGSHYSRSKSTKRYLDPSLTYAKIYRQYIAKMEELEESPVSKKVFMDIFHSDFNLSIKKPHTDTCKTCDTLKHSIQAVKNDNDKREIEEKKLSDHHTMIKKLKNEFDDDLKRAGDEVKVLTFDLQKALPTPKVPTNVAFYKRQLWTYNLCIYDEGTKQGHMYLWAENIASRGAQEIASCLLCHLKSLPPTVTKVILYSDSCGGQNRNIKMALFLKHFLCQNTHNITKITQKFFVSGHSYNSCDRSFGTIEKCSSRH